MTASTEFSYRRLEEVEAEELAQVLELLKDLRIAPKDVFAYSLAVTAVACADDMGLSVEGALEVMEEHETDIGIGPFFEDARKCLKKTEGN